MRGLFLLHRNSDGLNIFVSKGSSATYRERDEDHASYKYTAGRERGDERMRVVGTAEFTALARQEIVAAMNFEKD